MCQFNLILVKETKNKKLLKENKYNYLGSKIDGFLPYIKGHCNCGSFVGSMRDYDGSSFHEMVETLNKKELEKLNSIKNFMDQPNYAELRQKYIESRDAISNKIEQFYETLSDYEMEHINILETKYKGKELQKHTELLYKELDNKFKELENSQEFKLAQEKLNTFISQNQLMEASTFYYLTKEDEEKANQLDFNEEILLSDEITEALFDFEKEILLPDELAEPLDDCSEIIDITEEESLVIDNVIEKLENNYENYCKEFLEYKQLFEKLLENEECISFSCIWDEPEVMSLEKEINLKDITIEDLASLEYNKMLKIYR